MPKPEINYETMAMIYLRKMMDQYPDMTFGEILYAITRKAARDNGGKVSFLVEIKGREFCTLIENAIKEEKE